MKKLSYQFLMCAVLLWLGVTNVSAEAGQSSASSSSASLAIDSESASSAASATDDNEWRDRDADADAESTRRWQRHGRRHELVSIGHDAKLAGGERANTVVSILGSSTSEGEVSEEVVSILGNTRVTGPVGGDVVTVLGNAYVNSKVNRDVVVVAGNVELGPQAEVNGELVSVGGMVKRDPAAVVRGGVKDLSFGAAVGGFDWLHAWIDNCLRYARPLALAPGLGWAWLVALVSLLSYVLTAWLTPRPVDRCITVLEAYPGYSLLAALLTSLATPIGFFLLLITVIGIVVIPFAGIALLCVSFFGRLVMLAWLGKRLARSLDTSTPAHAALATLIGGIVVTVLYCVPVLGFVVYKLIGFVGTGAVVYTLILHFKSKRETTAPGVSASAAQQANHAQPQASVDGESETAGASNTNTAQGADHTSQQSTLDTVGLPRANFGVRMGALLLDLALVAFILNLVLDTDNILLLGVATYGALMWKLKGTTIGGILFNLRVVRLDGRELDWATVIVRALSCFLSLIALGLGFIWIAFDPERQAWHDKIAGTVVVRTPKGVSLV